MQSFCAHRGHNLRRHCAPRYGMFISRSLSENNQLRRVLGRRKMKTFKSEIIEVTDKNKSLFWQKQRFTTALSNVCFDTYNCGEGCLLEEKLKSFTERSAKRLLNKKGSGSGKTDLRQLTALTEYGCMTLTCHS